MIKKIEMITKNLLKLNLKFKDDGIKELINTRCDFYLKQSKENLNDEKLLENNFNRLEELYQVSERQLPIQNMYFKEESVINKE